MKILTRLAPTLLRILLSVMTIAITCVVLIAFRGFFSTSVVALLYLMVVVACTTLGGFSAGIAASVFAFLTFNYFFLPPLYTFTVTHTQDIIALFVFLAIAIFISNLMGRAQTRLEQIKAREREAILLFELSSTLTAIRDEKQIAEVLAQHLLVAFQGEWVEVLIQSNLPDGNCQDGPCIDIRLPEYDMPGPVFQQSQILSTNRGQLGEIHLWTKQPSLSPNELRLLQTIVSQAAMAVERAILSKSENRAKILEESDRLKTAILSSVSHDLRTPLALIQASASSLYDPAVDLEPGARAEMQAMLLEETEHLNQLVGNLLNMSRIEAGALKLQQQWNSMADLIDTVAGRMQRQTIRNQIEVDVSEELPLIQVDAILIEQVFINLISNSLKYAPIGSWIRIRAFVQNPDWMQVVLLNQGPAIPEEHLEHVFEKFYTYPGMHQVHSTGLGLSICKGIIEAHGGRIWASNRPDGLEFSFTLPLLKEGIVPMPADEASSDERSSKQQSTASSAGEQLV
jgi:two-component system, OmpR family, sensor histidine kinase KdpD